jgi:SAM-dependent methyltransferase
MDKHDLYEIAVQSPEVVVELLRGLHGANPRSLREDFSGTAAVSREWIATPDSDALSVDIDDEVLRLASQKCPRLRVRLDDAVQAADADPADVVFAGNFSIGYIYERDALVSYFQRTRKRLNPGGIFAFDMYGGPGAFRLGSLERQFELSDGTIVDYEWRHDAADPLTGMVQNSISFHVRRGEQLLLQLPRAFVYRWRLRGLPELYDALREAGFARMTVHADADPNSPVTYGNSLGDDWTVLVRATA